MADTSVLTAESKKAAPAQPAGTLPESYPASARELADLYFSGTTCVFVLYGNVHDLIRLPDDGKPAYCGLTDFLATQVFGRWDIVIGYDLSRGLRTMAGTDADRLRSMTQYLSSRWGEPLTWPRDPDRALLGLDAFIDRNLVEEPANRKSVALVFEYAQFLVPTGDLDSLAQGRGARIVRFLNWAQNPHIKRVNTAFVLVVDKLVEVSDRLVQSPHVATIEVPLPEREERKQFLPFAAGGQEISQACRFHRRPVGRHIQWAESGEFKCGAWRKPAAMGDGSIAARFRQLKKSMIERQCQGLVEFVEPKHTLDLVVGLDAAKQRLQEDAKWIGDGRLDAAPMGYLDLRPGRHRQIVSGGVLCRLDRHSLRHAAKFPLQVRRRNGRQLGASAGRAAVAGAGGGDRRRSRCGAGQSASRRRFGHVGPGVFDDCQPRWAIPDIGVKSFGCCSPAGPTCCRSI